jgi:hypothetical protein
MSEPDRRRFSLSKRKNRTTLVEMPVTQSIVWRSRHDEVPFFVRHPVYDCNIIAGSTGLYPIIN